MHKDWCGKVCADCLNPCKLDEKNPCSPDCEFLGADGNPSSPECQKCDALPLYRVPICYDGALYVRALSPEDAKEKVYSMAPDDRYQKSDGTWDIDDAELEEE